MLVMNFRVARVELRQRAMLDFAWKLTTAPATIGEEDRAGLREAGLGDDEIFDLAGHLLQHVEPDGERFGYHSESRVSRLIVSSRGGLTDRECGVSCGFFRRHRLCDGAGRGGIVLVIGDIKRSVTPLPGNIPLTTDLTRGLPGASDDPFLRLLVGGKPTCGLPRRDLAAATIPASGAARPRRRCDSASPDPGGARRDRRLRSRSRLALRQLRQPRHPLLSGDGVRRGLAAADG
jgi:hypothetical protein